MQSANEVPLTIYGTGGQTRAFIHIQNSMDCIELAIKNPPSHGDRVMILNQMTETHNLVYLSELLQRLYPHTTVQHLDNPRKELVENQLNVTNQKFLDMGLNPIYLDGDKVREIYNAIQQFKDRVDLRHIKPKSFW